MNFKFNLLIISVILLNSVFSYNINNYVDDGFEGCDGTENTNDLLKLTWKKVAQTSHGTLYKIQDGNNYVKLANITGTPYQMGYAYGQLLGEEVTDAFDAMLSYLTKSFENDFPKYPVFMRKYLAALKSTAGYELLGLNYQVALPYIPERYIQEMQGIADAVGFEYSEIARFNMFPELIKAACTIIGAWKDSTVDSKLLTLRALDWEPEAPVSKYPLITVYHSTEEGSYPFANVGYVGLIGSITALGSQGISVSEKVHLVRDTTIPSTYIGKPWTFVMRDLAQFSLTIDDMADSLNEADRTCPIYMGIASAYSNDFELVSYQWKDMEFYTDTNFTSIYSDAHPQLDGVTYVDKKVQPSSNTCIGNILSSYLGNIDWEVLFREVCGLHRTGDGQICISDVQENVIYLAYADPTTNTYAYKRAPMYIDLKPFYGITGSLKEKYGH